MPHYVVRQAVDLKQFLSSKLGISRGKAKQLIDTRNVLVNQRRVWIATHFLQPGDNVEVAGLAPHASTKPLSLPMLFENDAIIAVSKPAGILSDQDANSVETELRRRLKAPGIRAIHRLDRDTTGVLLLAKNDSVFAQYKRIWQEGKVTKTYLALCFGAACFRQMSSNLPIAGKSAYSQITALKTRRRTGKLPGYTLFRIVTHTGRRHQIRIHLNSLHHPIVGDKEYGPKAFTDRRVLRIGRQLLHCAQIRLPDITAENKSLSLRAPLGSDFTFALRQLGLS